MPHKMNVHGEAYYNRKRIESQRSSHGITKRLIIRKFEAIPKVNPDEWWPKLESAISSILNPDSPTANTDASLEELYQAVENLCGKNAIGSSAETYQKLKSLLHDYVNCTLLKPFLKDNERLLPLVDKTWQSYCVQLRMIRNIFLYLDRNYVLQSPRILSIWDVGLEIYRDGIINHENVSSRLFHEMLGAITTEREDGVVQQEVRSMLRRTVRLLIDLNIYEKTFEREFHRESKRFYSAEGAKHIQFVGTVTTDIIVKYFSYISDRLKEEADRVIELGMEAVHNTGKKLEKIVETELIHTHLDIIVNASCFDTLFADPRHLNSVNLSYDLLRRVPDGLSKLLTCFNQYIKVKGRSLLTEMVSDVEKEKGLIQRLLDFKDQVDRIARDCFASNVRFVNSLREAFETFVNSKTNKVAELIAKFLDAKLKDTKADTFDIPFDSMVDKILVLFRFIHGKDIFEAFYQRDLSKRLLGGKSASVDAEKLVLLKLKQECGGAFTSKLESMFKDMELSRDITGSFKLYLSKHETANKVTNPIDLNVSILTTGIWPTYHPIDLELPKDLKQYVEIFTVFYTAKYSGRKLTWQHSFGHCLIKAQFPKGTKELQVSFTQALVLLQFNQKTELSYADIRTAILPAKFQPMEENELRRTLQSLACGKIRVLAKNPKGRDVLDTDSFTFDDKFEHKLFRIKINQVQWKETYEENVQTQERVNQDRQYQLDAAVVRIMKARKVLQHNDLLKEVFEKINFPTSSIETKKRIDSLIERDYLRRDKDNPNQYHYVA